MGDLGVRKYDICIAECKKRMKEWPPIDDQRSCILSGAVGCQPGDSGLEKREVSFDSRDPGHLNAIDCQPGDPRHE
jgi:hypothetical protein